MGLGDNLMASGMARGAKDRGKRVAFGDGQKIIWDHHSEQIFRKNPNIAFPGCERDGDLEWIPFYRGNRLYNKQAANRWIWNHQFRAVPGEVYLADAERQWANWAIGGGFIIIEPNVPEHKTVAPNKQWPIQRYQKVATELAGRGYDVVQFAGVGRNTLHGVKQVKAKDFRHALAVMAKAALYIGPEGGLHHGAAAMGRRAVVMFGGFIPPAVTGYRFHSNLTGGVPSCGSLTKCNHCLAAMNRITVEEVLEAAKRHLLSSSSGQEISTAS